MNPDPFSDPNFFQHAFQFFQFMQGQGNAAAGPVPQPGPLPPGLSAPNPQQPTPATGGTSQISEQARLASMGHPQPSTSSNHPSSDLLHSMGIAPLLGLHPSSTLATPQPPSLPNPYAALRLANPPSGPIPATAAPPARLTTATASQQPSQLQALGPVLRQALVPSGNRFPQGLGTTTMSGGHRKKKAGMAETLPQPSMPPGGIVWCAGNLVHFLLDPSYLEASPKIAKALSRLGLIQSVELQPNSSGHQVYNTIHQAFLQSLDIAYDPFHFYQHTQKDSFTLSPVGFDAYKNLPPYTALKAAYHRKQFWIVADQRVSPDDTTYYKHLQKLGGKVSVNLDEEDDDEEEEEEVSDGLFDCHRCGSSFPLGIMDAHLEVCQMPAPKPKQKLPSLPSKDEKNDSKRNGSSTESASATTDSDTTSNVAARKKRNLTAKTTSASRFTKSKGKQTKGKGKAPAHCKPKGSNKPDERPQKKKPRRQLFISPSPSFESEESIGVGPSRSARVKPNPSTTIVGPPHRVLPLTSKGRMITSAPQASTPDLAMQPTATGPSALASSNAAAGPSNHHEVSVDGLPQGGSGHLLSTPTGEGTRETFSVIYDRSTPLVDLPAAEKMVYSLLASTPEAPAEGTTWRTMYEERWGLEKDGDVDSGFCGKLKLRKHEEPELHVAICDEPFGALRCWRMHYARRMGLHGIFVVILVKFPDDQPFKSDRNALANASLVLEERGQEHFRTALNFRLFTEIAQESGTKIYPISFPEIFLPHEHLPPSGDPYFQCLATDNMTSMAIGQHRTIQGSLSSASRKLVDTFDAFSHWTLVQCHQTAVVTDFTGTDTGKGEFLAIDKVYHRSE
ncbi:hypothetical protein FRC04_006240 [Tulasnella sp. 424]|nr:hypothetical protein FRC04_006240 [Tulasnella sp. 424]